MNAAEFSRTMQITIPKKMQAQSRRIFFDVGSQLHEAVVVDTPVRTGYLRSSMAFTIGSEAPPELPAKHDPHQTYSERPNPVPSLTEAIVDFVPWTMGFRADYATYVEDKVGMVKAAFARTGQMVRLAVRNAQGIAK